MIRAWVAVLLALGIAVFVAELGRRDGIAGRIERAALADSLRVTERRVDSLRLAYAAQKPAADRWRTRWDTLTLRGDTVRVRDTLYVPYEVVVVADSTIRACTRALGTCDALADSLTRENRLLRRDVGLSESQTRAAERREWWAAGAVYDGRFGLGVARDVGRLRLGASVTPNRAQVSGMVRW